MALPAHVGHRHAEQQRVDVVADDDVPAEVGRRLRVVGVQVQRVVVHRQQAEQVVVVLRDRLARPVLVDGADLELLVVAAELHGGCSSREDDHVVRRAAPHPAGRRVLCRERPARQPVASRAGTLCTTSVACRTPC